MQTERVLPNAFHTFRNVLGDPNHGIMTSVYSRHVQADSKRLYNDLWKSWTGMNYLHSEMYVLGTTELGGWILNMFPVMKLQAAIQQFPNLRVVGDTMTHTSFEFHASVLPEKSYQEWGQLQTSERSSTDTGFTHHGCGFAVPMDWMDQPTTRHFFGCSIKQMSASTHTTWNASILSKLEETCLHEFHSNLMKSLPMLPSEFKRAVDQVSDSCMALQKTGSGLQGIESKAVHVLRSRGVVPTMIITTATSIRYANAVREQTRMATDNGALIHPTQSANNFKSTDTEGTCRSPLFGIPMFEIPAFRLGATNTMYEPGQTILTISQRFLMLPSVFHSNDFANYTTNCRSTEIVDGDAGCFSVITLTDAYRASGLSKEGKSAIRSKKRKLEHNLGDGEKPGGFQKSLLIKLVGDCEREVQRHDADDSIDAGILFQSADILDQVCAFLEAHPERFSQLEKLIPTGGRNACQEAIAEIESKQGNDVTDAESNNMDKLLQLEAPTNDRGHRGDYADFFEAVFNQCHHLGFLDFKAFVDAGMSHVHVNVRLLYANILQKLHEVQALKRMDEGTSEKQRDAQLLRFLVIANIGPLPSLPDILDKALLERFFFYTPRVGYQLVSMSAKTVRHPDCDAEEAEVFTNRFMDTFSRFLTRNPYASFRELEELVLDQLQQSLRQHVTGLVQTCKMAVHPPSVASIKIALSYIHVNDEFFEVLLRHNIPFPVGFVLFRLDVRLRVGCCIFLKSGKDTGVVTIKDGRIMYQRDCDRFLVYVGSRFTTGICIFKPSNIELVPRTFATDYIGGAGVRLYDNTDENQVQQVKSCAIDQADIFVCAVPYYWTPDRSDTDITGKLDPRLVTVDELDDLHYPTADLYSAHWGKSEHHERAHLLWLTTDADAPDVQGRYTHAVQGLQRICKVPGVGGVTSFDEVIPGKDALGAFSSPADFAVFNNTADYLGRGVEGSHTRDRYNHAR
jgi:hypothetical protein